MAMNLFGKLKNQHTGPPVPPKRDNNEGFEWPQDEFDDEEGDMYEAPPCERPAVKVPQWEEEENVYLDRATSPAVPQKRTAPPARPGKPLNPPEIDRNEKPGRNKMMLPPPVRSVPPPVAAANNEEDVYLDPNEEQEDNDNLYLDPAAACAPAARGPIRTPPSPMTKPTMKLPVPRAKSNSPLPSLNELKTAPPAEARHSTFPAKLPPPTPSVKPPLPANLKEAKPSPPIYSSSGTKPVASFSGMRATKQSGNEDKEWFAGDCNRKAAEELLLSINKDGAFLIRHSSAHGTRQPYTLAVLYQQKVYNIPIRFLDETHGYALGKEGKKNEEIFSTLDEMISHHTNNQLLLIDSKSQAKHTAYLTHPARP